MIDQAEKLRQVIDNLKVKQAAYQTAMTISTVRRSARVITVTSGKGGVGKTNVAVNLAITLGELGQRVVILDADFGLANIDVLLGIVPKYSLADVIRNQKNIVEILMDGPRNVKFISGGSGVEDLVKLDGMQLQKFVENIALLDKMADVIIIDTGAGLSDTVMSFVMAADDVLLVTTPEPTSITDAYALIKMIAKKDRSKSIRLVINKAEHVKEATDIMNKLVLVSEKFLGIHLEQAGYILQDDAVSKSVKLQQPFSLGFPKSQAARNIREISDKLVIDGINVVATENTGIKGFVSKLVAFMKS